MREPPPHKVEEYPLLALLPEAVQEAGDYGFVEAQLVLNSWRSDELTDEARAELIQMARRNIQWALHHHYLTNGGDWVVVIDERNYWQIRLELVSWDTAAAYLYATRH